MEKLVYFATLMDPSADISVYFVLLLLVFFLLVFITIGLHLCQQYSR